MADNFKGANFHRKSEKALKINFRGFEFRDSNQSGSMVLHYGNPNVTKLPNLNSKLMCTSDDVINTRARSRS